MMRGRTFIMMLAAVVMSSLSCQRRDFAEKVTEVNLVLNVKTHVDNAGEVPVPETMRVDLYDIQTGKLIYTDYVGAEGGYIHPAPGTYDMIIYNIGTEAVQIRNESDINEIEAYTSEVSAYLKGQLAKFFANIAKIKEERQARESQQRSKSPADEKVIYEPDHLFVGRADAVVIPVIYEGEEREVLIEIDAHPEVETWKVTVSNVKGLEYVQNVVAVMSGQAESHFIGRGEDSGESVSVYFEKKKDMENKVLTGTFNTFGKHPTEKGILSLDINVTDTGGNDHHFHFDVDSQFQDNPDNHIVIDDPIEIEEPKAAGGGFAPSVDDWEDVTTDIEL